MSSQIIEEDLEEIEYDEETQSDQNDLISKSESESENHKTKKK